MIDDFCVPDDVGYQYDQYEGETLSLDYFGEILAELQCHVAYPTLPACREAGHRRGCIVVFPNTLNAIVRDVPSLRRIQDRLAPQR
jgi:hypothetical protein